MELLFLVSAFAFFRAKHGKGVIPRIWSIIIPSFALCAYHGLFDIIYLLPVIGMMAIGYSWGWGKWFSSFHGRYYLYEKEFGPIDAIIDPWGLKMPYLAGVIGMSLRWMIFFAPLYFFLDFATSAATNWYSLFYLAFIGVIYWISGCFVNERDAGTQAEPWTGALLGLSLAL
jgi:hypothetical protein